MRIPFMTPVIFILGALLLVAGLWRMDTSPERIWLGLTKLGWLVALMWPPSAGGVFWELLKSLLESLAMAFLGTLLAAVIAVPLALLGAGNVIGNIMLRFSARRLYDGLRGIDTLIWALIFVAAVGMGPFAGILALAVPDIGVLAKLFSEALEGADRRQVEPRPCREDWPAATGIARHAFPNAVHAGIQRAIFDGAGHCGRWRNWLGTFGSHSDQQLG
jgi:phosphonate transport system permease protein